MLLLIIDPICPAVSCSELGYANTPLYDHEHALLLCPSIMNFWTTIRNLIIHISGLCFISDTGSRMPLLNLNFHTWGCNVNR